MSPINSILRRLPWKSWITDLTPVVVHAGRELYTNIRKSFAKKPEHQPKTGDSIAESLVDLRARLGNLEAVSTQQTEALQQLTQSLKGLDAKLAFVGQRLTSILLIGIAVLVVAIVALVRVSMK